MFRTIPYVCVLLLTASSRPAHAEIAPEFYAKMQSEAPEALVIRIESVRTLRRAAGTDIVVKVTATARVIEVARTKSSLTPSRTISIVYERTERRYAIPGASEIPLLTPGRKCDAYLQLDAGKKSFAPAAGGYSFDRVVVKVPPPQG